jgi:hypothetical protein
MKKYMVSISQAVCADVEVEAQNEEEARNQIMSTGIDQERYCEGHRHTRVIDSMEEIKKSEE